MGANFAQNWPVYLLLGAFISFVVFAIRNSRQQEKINKEAQNKEKDKTQNKS
ncbi:MAG: hypothetical protein Q8N72_04045 [Candidatus Omnitrophota bacterium]|jgi:cbb3-type cytochrome oxidase subunit 3|nr:hypothetical protein [Candidatus Omnitrophota bacterium]